MAGIPRSLESRTETESAVIMTSTQEVLVQWEEVIHPEISFTRFSPQVKDFTMSQHVRFHRN
jgi:hypothetical protein